MGSSHETSIKKPSTGLDNKMDIDSSISPPTSESTLTRSNIPSYSKILVPHDGKEGSDKALLHAIYLSNTSNAEIIILRIIDDIDKLKGTSVNISHGDSLSAASSSQTKQNSFQFDVKGELVNSMEEMLKRCAAIGSKNKISYEFRTGDAVDEIVKSCQENRFDLVVLTSSHLDSWMRSLFSETRKIISNLNIPVLIVQ